MRLALSIAVVAALLPAAGSGQTVAAVNIGFSIPDGVAYQDLDPTPALGAYVAREILVDDFEAALAFEWSRHSLAATDQNVSEIDAYLMLRYHFPTRDVVRFFLGARAGFARQYATFSFTDSQGARQTSEASARGFGTGPTLGARFDRGAVTVELSLDGLVYWFGDLATTGSSQGGAANGSRFVPRVGLAVPFGS